MKSYNESAIFVKRESLSEETKGGLSESTIINVMFIQMNRELT